MRSTACEWPFQIDDRKLYMAILQHCCSFDSLSQTNGCIDGTILAFGYIEVEIGQSLSRHQIR